MPFESSNCNDFFHILDIYLHTFNVCSNICQFLRVCVCLSFACRLHLLYIVDMFLFLTCCFRFLFSSSKSCLNLFFVYFPHFYHHCHPSFKKGDAGSLWLMLFCFRYRKMFNIYHHFLFERNSSRVVSCRPDENILCRECKLKPPSYGQPYQPLLVLFPHKLTPTHPQFACKQLVTVVVVVSFN